MAPTLMPVAIVGMSCRLPGEVSTLDDFWTLMCRARSGWGEIPKDRFNKEAYWHPNPEKRGCFNSVGGYFLKEDIAKFDAPFFNITNNEASAMGTSNHLQPLVAGPHCTLTDRDQQILSSDSCLSAPTKH